MSCLHAPRSAWPWLSTLLIVACHAGSDDEVATDTDTDDVVVDCTPTPLDLMWSEKTTGHETRSITYEVPWSGVERTLGLELWYPTDATSGTTSTYLGVFGDAHALDGAPFADPAPGCKLPVVVYSHGSQSWGGSASTLVRHLVSQGWVAAAPDHTDNVFVFGQQPLPIAFSLVRTEDIKRTIDALASLPSDHPLAGRLDTDRVLVVGHSYGSQTAWMLSGPSYDMVALGAACDAHELGCTEAELDAFEAAEHDPRIVAVMPLDGTLDAQFVGASGWEGVDVPLFAQSRAEARFDEMFQRAAAAKPTWLSVEGSCHESFTGNPIECLTLDKEEGLGIVGRYFSAFAARWILGDERSEVVGILDGTVEVSGRAVVHVTE